MWPCLPFKDKAAFTFQVLGGRTRKKIKYYKPIFTAGAVKYTKLSVLLRLENNTKSNFFLKREEMLFTRENCTHMSNNSLL